VEIQQRLSEVLSEFARTLATDFSIQTILDQHVLRVVDVLPISGAGVTLMPMNAEARYVAASDDNAWHCERLQVAVGEGPGFAAYETGVPVTVLDLHIDERFPAFAARALEVGVVAVLSFPLCQGGEQIGALDLYQTAPGPFNEPAMAAAQTLADVTAAYLLIAQARVDLEETSERARQSSLHDDQAVRALLTSEERKTAILASALDAVITIDDDGRVVEFNPAAERTFGHSASEAGGLDLATLVAPPDALGDHWVGLDQYLATGDGPLLGRRIELTATRSDRSTFQAEVSITAVDGLGPRFFTAFVRDLTRREADDAERRRLEGRVQQTERLESLGQLAGGVAHDFNNLLTVILNYASFIADTVTNDAATRSHAGEIVASAERAARLTQQLLLFARREPVRRSAVDIGAVVAGIRDLLARAIGENVHLVVRAPEDLPPVTGDPGQIEQLLMNLAVNSRDAMPDGGELTIETALVRRGLQTFVRLSVTDTGEGMSADVASHAFDPFFTTKGAGEGSGLGLATVYGIVNDAGGTIDLRSEEGQGTTFTVEIPVVSQAAPTDHLEPATEAVDGRGETILVVEDQLSVRNVIVEMLSRNGYRVLEAADATSALELAGSAQFDLLLTDVVMPGRSGRELAYALRDREPGHQVLYMSGYSGGVFGSQRALDPREALIHKPFNEATLLAAVHTALGDHNGSASAPRDEAAPPSPLTGAL
jgi:two-component system cell cycle sensor histidine kinase/response regulator CckA